MKPSDDKFKLPPSAHELTPLELNAIHFGNRRTVIDLSVKEAPE